MKLDTRQRQVFQIEKFRTQYKRKKGKEFPKLFVQNTKKGYKVYGYESKDSGLELITSVLDCGDMDSDFFVNMILGPAAYYLGADDEDINGFLYFGGVRTGSHKGAREGGKYR